MNTKATTPITLLSLTLLTAYNTAGAMDFSASVGLETRYFPSDAAYTGQENSDISIKLEPQFEQKWDNDRKKFKFTPFYRWDNTDDERSHADIRQLDATIAQGDWEFQAGIGKIFWGVTESQHLVDIINQTDAIEGSDGEDKLGQPLFRVSRLLEDGSLDLIVLPYFRERTFPGTKGRLRTEYIVDTDQASYESDDEEKHIDYALRLNKTIGDIDLGLSWFDGTNRTPELRVGQKDGSTVLTPHYGLIQQAGIDVQYTGDGLLLKLEAVNRSTKDDDYQAATGGFEYTFSNINKKGLDLGVLTEYHHDSRGKDATSPFQKDVFVGTRLALNDAYSSQLLAGAMIDLDYDTKSLRVEGSRRWDDKTKINLEAQAVLDSDERDPMHSFGQDDYIKLEIERFF